MIDIKELQLRCKNKVNELENFKLKLQKELQPEFLIWLKTIAADFPEVKSFTWAQYTPYWNDGEECQFSISEYGMGVNGVEYEDFTDIYHVKTLETEKDLEIHLDVIANSNDIFYYNTNKIGDYGYYYNTQYNAEYVKFFKKVRTSFSLIEDELLFIFGDHAQIFINFETDNITIQEYEHD